MRKFMLGTPSPRLYWAGVFLGNVGTPPAPPGPGPSDRLVALVLASPSLRGGGLFFDYLPWLILGGGPGLLSVGLWLPFVRRLTGGLMAMTHTAEQIAEGGRCGPRGSRGRAVPVVRPVLPSRGRPHPRNRGHGTGLGP